MLHFDFDFLLPVKVLSFDLIPKSAIYSTNRNTICYVLITLLLLVVSCYAGGQKCDGQLAREGNKDHSVITNKISLAGC